MISFTDQELRTASLEIITLPDEIAGYNQNLSDIIALKQEHLEEDNVNAVFYNHYQNVINQYHAELVEIDGTSKTNYSFSTLDDSAALRPNNLHYPIAPPWVNYQPKLLPENNGNPTSAMVDYEINRFGPTFEYYDLLKNGYSDGALDDTTTLPYSSGSVNVTVGGFLPGQRIVIDSGNQSVLGVVLTASPSPGSCSNPFYLDQPTCLLNGETWTPGTGEDITFTVLSDDSGVSIGAGARVRNWHPGFSNNEREGVSTPYAPEVMAYWGAEHEGRVILWQNYLLGQEFALLANDAEGAEFNEILLATNKVQAALTAISNFQSAPLVGAGIARYGNNIIDAVEAQRLLRIADAPARVVEINNALSSVSQGGTGSFSGSGNYKKGFDWIVLRSSLAQGSLFLYYYMDKNVAFTQDILTNLNNKLAEYQSAMVSILLVQNANGTNVIKLANTVGLGVSNSVKILSSNNLLPIISTTIIGITGQDVTLSTPIPNTYLTEDRARLVRLL